MSAWSWGVGSAILALAHGVVISLLGQELEAWLESVPRGLLRLARRRLPASHVELYEEWARTLEALLAKDRRPLSRCALGMRYALGLLWASRHTRQRDGQHAR